MTISWANGNGDSRIVVVREGSATSWTPTDGVAPSGVNSDFMQATDQGSGNKICYDGTGGIALIQGLNPGTMYSFRIFEYNGTGTAANYLTGGVVLAGSQYTN